MIRFRAPYCQEEEEYIDLIPILKDLYYDINEFEHQ